MKYTIKDKTALNTRNGSYVRSAKAINERLRKHMTDDVSMIVDRDSYAAQYCIENEIEFSYRE